MKRVAIPVKNNQLSEYFGGCSHYELFDIEQGKVIKVQSVPRPEGNLTILPQWAAQHHITEIISHRIDRSIIALFSPYKINLYVGIPQKTSKVLIASYLEGLITSDNQLIHEILTTHKTRK